MNSSSSSINSSPIVSPKLFLEERFDFYTAKVTILKTIAVASLVIFTITCFVLIAHLFPHSSLMLAAHMSIQKKLLFLCVATASLGISSAGYFYYRLSDLQMAYKAVLDSPNNQTIYSNLLGKDIYLWERALTDLNRLLNLKVNDKVVLDSTNDIPDNVAIVDKILEATVDNDVELVQQLVKLLEQTWVTQSNHALIAEADILNINVKETFSKKEHSHQINIAPEGTFEVVHNISFKKSFCTLSGFQDETKCSIFVNCTLKISGKIEDLKSNNIRKLQIDFRSKEAK